MVIIRQVLVECVGGGGGGAGALGSRLHRQRQRAAVAVAVMLLNISWPGRDLYLCCRRRRHGRRGYTNGRRKWCGTTFGPVRQYRVLAVLVGTLRRGTPSAYVGLAGVALGTLTTGNGDFYTIGGDGSTALGFNNAGAPADYGGNGGASALGGQTASDSTLMQLAPAVWGSAAAGRAQLV